MPTFPAPTPVPVLVEAPFSTLHVVASDRDDVVVTVLPADPGKSGSVRAAEETVVGRDGDAVTITYASAWKQYVRPFAAGVASITVELPTGSDVRGKAGSLYAEGRLGTLELTLGAGEARVDEAARVDLKVAAGGVVVHRITAAATIRANAGSVRIEDLTGDGGVRAANGTITVGAVTGSLDVVGANGDVAVGHVRGTVTVKSANAGIRVDRLESGSVALTTAYGSIEVGVPDGTAAWLDVASEHGAVRNQLLPTEGPGGEEATAEIRAATAYGDVIVRRS